MNTSGSVGGPESLRGAGPRGRGALLGFLLVTAAGAAWLGLPFARGGESRSVHLPGPTTRGHHLIENACDQCHTPFHGVTNDACNRCHAAGLAAANDSHPEGKFTDPRNAERVRGLDARACVTCHREHTPDRTGAYGATLARDFCVSCHDDVAKDRPSHEGVAFARCSDSGCHHFHDNSGLYEDFLAKHQGEPDLRESPFVATRARWSPGASGPLLRLTARDHDAPLGAASDRAAVREWDASAHAEAGVNCSGCHRASAGAPWVERPDHTACAGCHGDEVRGFLSGLHGMRIAAGLSPRSPALARLAMKPAARERELGCGSCHAAHRYDVKQAAAAACLGCHDDGHSRAHEASKHADRWAAEVVGSAREGSGVSCATCHMPRVTRRRAGADEVRAEHDQSANLRPPDKMIRSVCLGCHGLAFTIDALADPALAAQGYEGRPSAHVESLAMVARRARARAAEKGERR